MSFGVIRSSMPSSCVCSTISERRSSPNWSRIAVSSSTMICGDALRLGQDVEQVDDLVHHLLVFGNDLVLLQAGQALQAQFQDRLGLGFGQAVALGRQAELRRQPSGREASEAARSSISSTTGAAPQCAPSGRPWHPAGVGAALIRAMISSTLDSATARPSRMWPRSRALRSSNTVRRVTTSRRCDRKHSSICLQVQQARLAVDQRHHVHAEGVLQLGLLVQVVEDDLARPRRASAR